MTKELAVIPKGMAALSAPELGALHTAFRFARLDVWDLPYAKRRDRGYFELIIDLQAHDPLFGTAVANAEVKRKYDF